MQDISFKDFIIYEDDYIIVVNKPPLFPSLPERFGYFKYQNVFSVGREYFPNLSLCHRIDKETSGVLIMAKTEEIHREIALQFQHRQVEKHYHAIVEGIHHFENYEIDIRLYKISSEKVVVRKFQGKKAQTIVNTLENFRHYTLLDCKPVSGRMHQIRAHLSAVHCPLVGDETYGGKHIFLSSLKRDYKIKQEQNEIPLDKRFLLHAREIFFLWNQGKNHQQFTAEYPKDFKIILKQLRKYNA